MRLSASQIAWPPGADAEAAALLVAHGIAGVELVPARVCERPWEADWRAVAAVRRLWEEQGLPIVALQALLFGRDGMALFGSEGARRLLADHLAGIVDLAAGLGAESLVFGAPRQRRRGTLDVATATAIAVPFFRTLARRAADRGVWLCLDANPPAYGCDFLTASRDVIDFVSTVAADGLGVHLDTGGMHLAGESAAAVIAAAGPRWRHVHASDPHLVPLGDGGTDHRAVARLLATAAYDRWVSVEIGPPGEGEDWRARLGRGLAVAAAAYAQEGETNVFPPPQAGV